MKKSREELTRIHKEKCKELKRVRAQIAADLGIDLKQTECTYEGYCSGTCPKCKSEEIKLNLAIIKRQMESIDMKRKVAMAGLTTAAALTLSGCNISNTSDWETTEGAADPRMWQTEDIEGKLVEPETSVEWELSGDIAIVEESAEDSTNE